MEHDSKTLQALLADVSKKLERHEWRIVDLEKRLIIAHFRQEDASTNNDGELETYKESILQKATLRGAASPLNKSMQNRKEIAWYILCLCGGSAAVAYVGYWATKAV